VQEVAGHFAAVDHAGRLAEAGWQKFPTLMHAAWAAQWLEYEARLAARLARPAITLRVFHDEVCMRTLHPSLTLMGWALT